MNSVYLMHWAGPGLFALLLVAWLGWWDWRPAGRSAGRRSHQKDYLEIRPGYRSMLRRLGLVRPEHFLTLPSLTISGHPDRNVSRVTLGERDEAVPAYLKREHRIPWSIRLRNALAGFGLVSRSLRECRVLQALQREGLPCPDWIAAGEDGQGRAFLLLRANTDARDLRRALREETDFRVRRRLVRVLGENLARLHHKGFTHPDLYANHVLVQGDGPETIFLDWQRTRPSFRLSWSQRGRDLAGLHVTLPGELATQLERWSCLRAYLAETARLAATTGQRPPGRGLLRLPGCTQLLRGLQREMQRRLRRRHVLEKRQYGQTQAQHDWLRLDGEALCVTSSLDRHCPDLDPASLALEQQPMPRRGGVTRRWLPMPGSAPVLLARRRAWSPLASTWAWLRGRRWSSPEQRQSVLLLRLQRHGIPVPGVLAMGQRQQSGGRQDSFLLTAPQGRVLRLDLWLQRQGRQRTEPAAQDRQHVLRQVGALLARLHQACCFMDPQGSVQAGAGAASVLGVRVDSEPLALTVLRIEGIRLARAAHPARARRDHARFQRSLVEAGCDLDDLRQVSLGYRQQLVASERPLSGIANRKEATACQV